MQFFMQGGIIMWVVLLFLLIDAVMIIKAGILIYKKEKQADAIVEKLLNNGLWMGILSAVAGLLGTALGFYHASGAISKATNISLPIIWEGVHVALTTLIFGLFVFLFTAIVVLILRTKLK